jgi:hypothetical protein
LSNIALHFAEQIGDSRIPLSKIDGAVNKRLGPACVRGNAQPNALYRQIAMSLGKHVGWWSTTQIGRFYSGRDHSSGLMLLTEGATWNSCTSPDRRAAMLPRNSGVKRYLSDNGGCNRLSLSQIEN